jgi:hypothetical protein
VLELEVVGLNPATGPYANFLENAKKKVKGAVADAG